MIVLNAPAGDEAPILLRNFLKVEQPSLLICRNLSSAQAIVQDAAEGTARLICSDKPVSPAKGILPGKGIENLTDLNLQINEALGAIQPKRLALDILSDVLLRHKALQTRKWLTELLERLRSRSITTLAVLNPYMHTAEETQALVDVFDASIEVFEREGRKSLRINWAHGLEASQREFPLEGFVAEKKVSSDERRVAVLPFANMSPDPNDEYFADGLTEELIDRLSQVTGLEVIARTSVMSYKKKEKKIAEIAKELSVGSLVEGSVRKAGSRIRVTAQLINAATEAHLWSSHYDKNLDDIFAVQSEIAEKVAGELQTQLLDSEKKNLEKKPTGNIEAYTYFLQGRELYREETGASLRQAIGLFEKAIQFDPGFAKAYVGVADCHLALAESGQDSYGSSLSNAKAPLDRALNLDPNLPEAHASLSGLLFDMDDMPGSEAEARRALELNPSLPDPYRSLFELAALKEDPEEMVRQVETAYRLDPVRPNFIWLLGEAYLYTGRGQDALVHWKKTEQLAPASVYSGMTEYYIAKGDLEKAKEFQAKAEKLEPTRPRYIWLGGVIAALEGDRERALLVVKKIEDAKMGPIGLNYIAYVCHTLGDLDSFFEYMNRVLESHALIPLVLMHSPILAKARVDPRYRELMEKLRKQMGLTK
jgi:adenylate cyclase